MNRTLCVSSLLVVCLFLLPYSSKGQEQVSTFRFPKPPSGIGQAFEIVIDQQPQVVLFFNSPTRLKLRYLDTNLQFLREVEIRKEDDILYYNTVIGHLQRGNTIDVFYKQEGGDAVKSLTMDIENHSYQLNDAKIIVEKGEQIVKTFTHGDRYYVIKLVKGENIFRIHFFDDASEFQTHDLTLPVADLFHRFKRDQKFYLPLIDFEAENTLFTTFLPEKLYIIADTFVFTFEHPDSGFTQVISVDTKTWHSKERNFPYPNFKSDSKVSQTYNSFLYPPLLYQVTANPDNLYLSCVDVELGKSVQQYSWQGEQMIREQLGPATQKRPGKMKSQVMEEMLPSLQKSLALVVNTTDSLSLILTIGSYLHVDSRTANVVADIKAVSSASSSVFGSMLMLNAPHTDFMIALPYIGLSTATAGYINTHQGPGRYVSTRSIISPEGAQFQDQPIPLSLPEKIDQFLWLNRLEKSISAICIFERNNHTYFGYGHRKAYSIIEF